MDPRTNNGGTYFKVKAGNVPVTAGAATRTSGAIDRQAIGNPQSCKLVLATGAATGAPDSFTADLKIQDCATSGGSYTDYVPPRGVAADAAVTQITADNTVSQKDVDLSGAKQFLKLVEVLAMTGGTSPKQAMVSSLIVCGENIAPAI